jgi:crotonobetainyl-CoA:carnitine CoA-transferase CaiB-like acyl-CoA transferase
MGNAHPSIAPYDLFGTADGDIVLAVGNERQFSSLCRVLGAPALADDERFSTNTARVANRPALYTELEALFAARAASDWVVALTAAGVPAGEVNDIAGAFALAQRLGLEPVVDVPRTGGGSVRLVRNPIRLSATPPRYRTGPPALPGDP